MGGGGGFLGLGGAPSTPYIPPAPKPETPQQTKSLSAGATAAAQAQREKQKRNRGLSASILTNRAGAGGLSSTDQGKATLG